MFPKRVGFSPKSSILIGFSIINHPFWGTPIFGNTHTFQKQLVPRNLSAPIGARLAPIVGVYWFVWPAIGVSVTSLRSWCYLQKSTAWKEMERTNKPWATHTLKREFQSEIRNCSHSISMSCCLWGCLSNQKSSLHTTLTCFRSSVTCCEGNRLRWNLKAVFVWAKQLFGAKQLNSQAHWNCKYLTIWRTICWNLASVTAEEQHDRTFFFRIFPLPVLSARSVCVGHGNKSHGYSIGVVSTYRRRSPKSCKRKRKRFTMSK